MRFFIILCCGIFLPLFAWGKVEKCIPAKEKSSEFHAKVFRLSDGDTISVKTEQGKERRIRFLYVDTPETHFQGQTQGEAGERAHAYLEKLIPVGTVVTVRMEESPCDIYGRYLGKVYKNEEEINLRMVKEGYATSLCFAPNLSNCEDYVQAAKASMKKGNVFTEYAALVPHEFRFQVSGKPEAPWVASLQTKKVLPFARHKEIEVLDRVFFSQEKDIRAPYRLVKEKR